MAGRHYGIVMALLLSCLITLTFNVQQAKERGTIYIRVDGSVYPSDAPIVRLDNATYVFIGNANDSIAVERDNILIDGASYTLQGGGKWAGVNLTGRSNVTLKNLKITKFYYGIYLYGSTHITLFNNTASNNEWDGIYLLNSIGNFLCANTVSSNKRYGIILSESSNNRIFHNNFINNTKQAYTYDSFSNVWDDGYPSGGNYWSDYDGVDPDSDGIGNTTYTIDADNADRYPLMGSISIFNAGIWSGGTCTIDITSNSTVSKFQLNITEKTISFNVTGVEGYTGFCRIIVPNIIVQNMWQNNYTVLLNDQPWPFRNWTDAINTYIYISYTHSIHEITIIPEFPSTLILTLFMMVTLTATILLKTKREHQLP